MLLSLGAIQFTNILDFMIMAPLAPQLMKSFNITTQQFGYLLSAYTISAGISGFISAFFADNFDRKSLLRLVYIGFLIGTAFCAFAPTYELLLLARLFTGAFGGIIGATCLTIVSDTVPMERRGQAMGIVMTAFSLASVLGIPIGLKLATIDPALSWHLPFIVLVGIGVLVFFALNAWIPKVNAHLTRTGEKDTPLEVLEFIIKDPNQLWALSLMAMMMFGQFILIPFISQTMIYIIKVNYSIKLTN
jgi:predicted MFS family arabinose efflux permease